MKLVDLDIQVITCNPPQVLVRWQFHPGVVRGDYNVQIYRGESDVSMEKIHSTDGSDLSMFLDVGVQLRNFHKKYYYSIVLISKKDGAVFKHDPVTWLGDPDLESIYVREEHEFLLEDATGMPSLVFIHKNDGVFCTNCFDTISKKRIKSRCNVCYGTNFVGGYYKPIFRYIDFSPDNKFKIVDSIGEMQPSELNIVMSPYPILTPGDMILEILSGDRYVVKKTNLAEKRRLPLLQAAVIEKIPKFDICYELPVSIDTIVNASNELDRIKRLRNF